MLVNNVLIKKLRVPVYGTPFWIVVADNVPKAIDVVEDFVDRNIANQKDKKSLDAYTYAYEDHDGVYRMLVFLTPYLSPGRVAHEAHHAVNILFSWHGVRPSFTNDENESYYLEQMVDKLHRVLNHYKKLKDENNS